MRSTAPPEAWTEWGGEGPALIFGHANGFPPGTYRQFLEELSRSFSVSSFAARPLWPESDPGSIRSWHDLADDLGDEFARRGVQDAIGVGHSLGSVLCLLAAAADSSRFAALALMDPVIFTGIQQLFWGALKGLGLGSRLPLIRGALRRREVFSGFDEVRSSYRGKTVFATWDPAVLEDYVQAGFAETAAGGVRLRYPKVWEARIFELTPASVWREFTTLDVPVFVIRGAASDTFSAAAALRMRRELSGSRVIELPDTGHFMPMEKPREVAKLITDWAREMEF